MLDREVADMGVEAQAVDVGIAEELVVRALQRAAIPRRNAAIGDAAVVGIFVGQVDPRIVAELPAERRIDADAAAVDMVAEAVEGLVNGVDAARQAGGQRRLEIDRAAPRAMAVEREDAARRAAAVGLLGDAIDHPAAAAAAEDHRIGALEHFDPVEIVEPAIILDVVADAVDEEIGGAVLAAQDDRVAMPLARRDAGAGDGAQHVADRAHALVVDALLGDRR